MSTIEGTFIALPTHRSELVKRGEKLQTVSMLETLSVYTSYTTERLKINKQSAYLLVVRLTEMDILAGVDLIGNDTSLILDVLTNKRVILKNYSAIKTFISDAKAIAEKHQIANTDPRLQKIADIGNAVSEIGETKMSIPSFQEEFRSLSQQDLAMIESLDNVYLQLLQKRQLKAPESTRPTLEDETRQYLRMYLAQQRGEKTIVPEPQYQLKWFNQIWKEKLSKTLQIIYPQSAMVIHEDRVTIDGINIDKKFNDVDDINQHISTLMQNIHEQSPVSKQQEIKDKFLSCLCVNLYKIGNLNWKETIDNIQNNKQKQYALSNVLELAYENNDIQVFEEIFQTLPYWENTDTRMTALFKIVIMAYDKNDQRYKQWFTQIESQTEREEALKHIAIKAFANNDPNHQQFLNLIEKNVRTVEVLKNWIICAYKKNDTQYKKWLKEAEAIALPFDIALIHAEMAVADYARGKSNKAFLRQMKYDRRILDDYWLKVAEYEYEQGGDFHSPLLKAEGIVKYQLLEKIAINAYKKNDIHTLHNTIKQFEESLKDFGFEDLVRSGLWYKLGQIAFEKNDPYCFECIKSIPEKDYQTELVCKLAAENHLIIDAYQAYTYYTLTYLPDVSKIISYLNSLPQKPLRPYDMSPFHAYITNKIFRKQPETLIEQMSAVSYFASEFLGQTLSRIVFTDELFSHLPEKDRAWTRAGYNPLLLNRDLPEISANLYLMSQAEGSLEGGDPRGTVHKVLKTDLPAGSFLITQRLTNINEFGKGQNLPISFDKNLNLDSNHENTYTVSYIPKLQKGRVTLAISSNSVIKNLRINNEQQNAPTANEYQIDNDQTSIAYDVQETALPNMPLVAYAQEGTVPEELKNCKLPYELEGLIGELRALPFADQLTTIQNLRDRYFLYDFDNKRVVSLKTNTSLRQRLVIMRKRAEEIKKESPQNNLQSIRWAGVCSDITFVSAALLAKLDIPFYIDLGFMVNNEVVTTQNAHSQIAIPLVDEEDKRYDLAFDPVNNIMRIGNVKINHTQLNELIPVDKPETAILTQEQKEKQNEIPAYFSYQHTASKAHRSIVADEELYSKIAAIGQTIAGSSVLRPYETWDFSTIDRLDEIHYYFLSKIWQDILNVGISEKQARIYIIDHTLSYIRKHKGKISKKKLLDLIVNHKDLSFLLDK